MNVCKLHNFLVQSHPASELGAQLRVRELLSFNAISVADCENHWSASAFHVS